MEETLSSTNTSTKRTWIAEQARQHPERVFSSLHHLIDLYWMREAYRRTRKDGAPGIDGVTATNYEQDLEANLNGLPNGIKSGSYRASPVRRHYIPKADGRQRPLGISTLEDKVAQRAIVMLLEPICEADFLPCSFGFRPGRSAHEALDALYEGIARRGTGVGDRRGHRGLFRQHPAHAPASFPRPEDQGWRRTTHDRQMTEGGSTGGRCPEPLGYRHAAGRCDQPAAGKLLPAPRAGPLVCRNRAAPAVREQPAGAVRR